MATIQCAFKRPETSTSGSVTQYSEKQAWLNKQEMNCFFKEMIGNEEAQSYEVWEGTYNQYVQGLQRKDKLAQKHHLWQETWELIQQRADEEAWLTTEERR